MSQEEIDRVANLIKNWLVAEGNFKDKIEDPDAYYHFRAIYPKATPSFIDIVIPKASPDAVVIAAGVNVSQVHKDKLKLGDEQTRRKFILEFQLALAHAPAQYTLYYEDKTVLHQFAIIQPIYFDGLTKDKFMRTLQDVSATKIIGILQFHKYLGIIPEEENQQVK